MSATGKPDKPLKAKAYGSIGHLPVSRLGPGDWHVHEGQARICHEKPRKGEADTFNDALDNIGWPLPNVWLGTSIANQEDADSLIPQLLGAPAALRFLSCEPLLGPIDLTAIRRKHAEGFMRPLDGRLNTIGWVIGGGESGPHARPMHPDWARSLRDQCAAAGVPFFFKQWGEFAPCEHHPAGTAPLSVVASDGQHLTGPSAIAERGDDQRAEIIARFGKKLAGRLLDGVEHSEFPKVEA